jgi:hypothetical protein
MSSIGKLGLTGNERIAISPVRNQGPEEECWAFGACGLVESQFATENPGRHVKLSTEYQGFYNIYFQIKNRLGYFRQIANRIEKMPRGAARDQAIQDASAQAYASIKQSTRYVDPTVKWAPNQGSDEVIAFKNVENVGMVPGTAFNGVRKTERQEQLYENAIQRFIGQYMFDSNNLDTFQGKADDGINDALFNALASKLKRYYGGQVPLRPDETFTYNRQIFTPRTFMQDYLKFSPDDWRVLTATKQTHQLALNAMAAAMERGYSSPLGFVIYGDTAEGTNLNFQQMAEITGIFTPKFCPGGKCAKVIGGHEVRAINYLRDDDGNVTGLIVENSWGKTIGRARNGRRTSKPSKRGFFVITADYLLENMRQGGWDFVLPKDVADLPEFAGLKPEKN